MYKNTRAIVIVGEKVDTKDNWERVPDFMYKSELSINKNIYLFIIVLLL